MKSWGANFPRETKFSESPKYLGEGTNELSTDPLSPSYRKENWEDTKNIQCSVSVTNSEVPMFPKAMGLIRMPS